MSGGDVGELIIFQILIQVKIWNLRIRLRQLSSAIRELGKYGPMKSPDKAGLDEVFSSTHSRII